MNIVTYNVNSLNARLPRVLAMLEEHRPDIVLLQETKCRPEKFPHTAIAEAGYLIADHSGGQWAGVAVLARSEHGLDDVVVGLPGEPDPDQARWVEATVGGVRAVSVYVPNGQTTTAPQYTAKLQFFDAMATRAKELADGPTVIGGDMNVCPTTFDAWDEASLTGGTHVSQPERTGWENVVASGYCDTFRDLYPDDPGYSWWDYRFGNFHKGRGLRIDMILTSASIRRSVTDSMILREFRKANRVTECKPSDHTPLMVETSWEATPGRSATNDAVAALATAPTEPEQLELL